MFAFGENTNLYHYVTGELVQIQGSGFILDETGDGVHLVSSDASSRRPLEDVFTNAVVDHDGEQRVRLRTDPPSRATAVSDLAKTHSVNGGCG